MGKAKRELERHDKDVMELCLKLGELCDWIERSSLSVAEAVGNLECAKWMLLRDADEAEGKAGDSGIRIKAIGIDRETLESLFGEGDE